MKFYLDNCISCDVHHEKSMIETIIKCKDKEICEYIDHADYIILTGTCAGTYEAFLITLDYIKKAKEWKKDGAKLIVSGCLANGVNFELTEEQKEILKDVEFVKPHELAEYVAKIVDYEKETKEDFDVPMTIYSNYICSSFVQGCLNNCSFCKKNYMNFDLRSVPKASIEHLINGINADENDYPLYYGSIVSSNLSLYGVDLYNERKAHEVINTFSKLDSLKFMNIGALINWYPELINEIISNPKIKQIFTSIETGSPRLYELMDRPIPLNKLTEIIKFIKKERPDINIQTEFIAGFPTETHDDIKATLDLIEELEVDPYAIHSYIDSFCVPSSKLKQHSEEYTIYSAKYMDNKLQNIKDKIDKKIESEEKIVAHYFHDIDTYRVILKNGNQVNISAKKLDRKYKPGDIIK